MENRLKKARKNAGLTQPQLAALIGVSLKSIKNYEKDASKIAVTKVKKIALGCGVDEIWLLTGHGKMIDDRIDSGTEESSSNGNIAQVIIEHQDIIKRFKDPELGKNINEQLVVIQDNSGIFKGIVGSIKAAFDTVMAIKDTQMGNYSAPGSSSTQQKERRKEQRPEQSRGQENKKSGTNDQ